MFREYDPAIAAGVLQATWTRSRLGTTVMLLPGRRLSDRASTSSMHFATLPLSVAADIR
jgi:hypothetical protein